MAFRFVDNLDVGDDMAITDNGINRSTREAVITRSAPHGMNAMGSIEWSYATAESSHVFRPRVRHIT